MMWAGVLDKQHSSCVFLWVCAFTGLQLWRWEGEKGRCGERRENFSFREALSGGSTSGVNTLKSQCLGGKQLYMHLNLNANPSYVFTCAKENKVPTANK